LVYAVKTQGLTHLRQVAAMWRKAAPESEMVDVEGSHTTIMRQPDGFPVAKRLAERIAEIESRRTRSGGQFDNRKKKRQNPN
jgi:thioesterase domain-containing protein